MTGLRSGSALAEDDGRRWTMDVADHVGGPLVVRLAPGEAAAAIDALIGNVFAHTPEGTAYALSVRAGSDGAVQLVIEDAGPGIDDPDAALGRGATHAGSTGLGLDIVRQAAEAAGGRLHVGRSVLGGARFEIEMPRSGERRQGPPQGRLHRSRRVGGVAGKDAARKRTPCGA